MCSPQMALGMQAAGAAADTVGAIYSATGQRAALRSQARIADLNARQAEDAARFALDAGSRAESRLRLETAQLKSRQRVALAAGGAALDEGTALHVQTSTDYMGEVDALQINENATREAAAIRMRAAGLRSEAIMARGAAAGISPFMAGATSLLGGAGKVASSWYGMKKTGAI